MGRNTFDFVARYDGPFPYPNSTNYVFSNSDIKSTLPIEVISGNAIDFVADLKRKRGKDIWLIGGGRLNTSFADEGMIDEIILTQIPVFLGAGIPIFNGLKKPLPLTLVEQKSYANNVRQDIWICK